MTVQNEDLSNESNFIEDEGLNFDDLLTSSQKKISALSFFDFEAKEGDKVREYGVEDDGEEGEDPETDKEPRKIHENPDSKKLF